MRGTLERKRKASVREQVWSDWESDHEPGKIKNLHSPAFAFLKSTSVLTLLALWAII